MPREEARRFHARNRSRNGGSPVSGALRHAQAHPDFVRDPFRRTRKDKRQLDFHGRSTDELPARLFVAKELVKPAAFFGADRTVKIRFAKFFKSSSHITKLNGHHSEIGIITDYTDN